MNDVRAAELRRLLAGAGFLPGKYPNRPAPMHLLGNFALHALSPKSSQSAIRSMLFEDLDPALASLLPEGQRTSPGNVDALSTTLAVLLNSDARLFPSRGSVFPISPEVLASDPSDEGYARALWRALPPDTRRKIAENLAILLEPLGQPDPVSQLAILVRRVVEAEPTLDPGDQDDAGSAFGESIGPLLVRVTQVPDRYRGAPGALRYSRLKSLATMLGVAVVLGLLYEGGQHHGESDGVSVADILGVVVFTGQTPGEPADPLVKYAQASLSTAIQRSYAGTELRFGQVMTEAWRSIEHESGARRLRAAVLQRVPGTDAEALTSAIVQRLDLAHEPPRWELDAVLPIATLRQAVRSIGVKVGLVGPQRGAGQPRMLLETPVLAALVDAVTDREMSLQEFTQAVYDSTGLILGPVDLKPGQASRVEADSTSLGDQEEMLFASQDHLTYRMTQAGLARQFSDGLTMVFPR